MASIAVDRDAAKIVLSSPVGVDSCNNSVYNGVYRLMR